MKLSSTWANQLAEIGLTNQLFNNGIKRSWLLCRSAGISWSPSGPLARLALGTGYTRAQRTFTSGTRTDRQTDCCSEQRTLPPPPPQRHPLTCRSHIKEGRNSEIVWFHLRSVWPSGDVWMDNWFRIIVHIWERDDLLFFQGSGVFLRFRGRRGFITWFCLVFCLYQMIKVGPEYCQTVVKKMYMANIFSKSKLSKLSFANKTGKQIVDTGSYNNWPRPHAFTDYHEILNRHTLYTKAVSIVVIYCQ